MFAPSARVARLDYERQGRDLLQRHGLESGALTPSSYHELLAQSCARVEIGPIVIHLPKEGFLAKGDRANGYPAADAVLQSAVAGVLHGLAEVGRWSGADKSTFLSAKDVSDFTSKISLAKDFDLAAHEATLTLAELFAKGPDKRAEVVLEKLDTLLALPGLAANPEGKPAAPIPFLVLPTRREMVEYACAAGIVDPTLSGVFHQPAITGWIHSYFGAADANGRVQILCLEEGLTGDDALERWTESSQTVDLTLIQQSITYDLIVAWVAARSESVPNWFALGLGFEGVLTRYGELAGRLGADSIGDVTPPRTAFVAGGNSNGGMLAPNESEMRGTLTVKELRRVLEDRKQAAYELLEKRDVKDEQRKAAKGDDEVIYFHLRSVDGSDVGGHLHFGPYLGQDVSFLIGKGVGSDLARVQRSHFALVVAELAALDKGAALTRLLAAISGSGEEFDVAFQTATGRTPRDLEQTLYAKLKKK